jgi:hypothetical protein
MQRSTHQIHRVLAHGADLSPGADPTSLREGVDNTRVSLFAFTFSSLCNLNCSLGSCLPARSFLRMLIARHGGSPYSRMR